MTWDDDDPERNQITRRTLSRKEIEENDYRAYIASSESESEEVGKSSSKRDKLRALLLSGGDDTLPEGWGHGEDDGPGDADMEITFTPGLSETKNDQETTLEVYKRKMKEKKKKRKEELVEKRAEKEGKKDALDGDDFFAAGSGDEESDEEEEEEKPKKGKGKGKKERKASPPTVARQPSTAEELALIAASDNPDKDPKHFDLKAVIKAEKSKGKKRKQKKGKTADQQENETQDDFKIDVKDDRFTALHEDHTFAIDPSNPQ